MTTPSKIEANRRNCLNSTGPRTPEGKRISSQNASKLGIFSRELLLREENEAELHFFGRAIRGDLRPSGPIECSLVELIISTLWRLRRLLRIECGLFDMYKVYKGVDGGAPVAFAHDASQLDCFSRVARMETALERRLYKSLHELRNLQASRLRKSIRDSSALEVDVSPKAARPKEQNPAWRQWIGL